MLSCGVTPQPNDLTVASSFFSAASPPAAGLTGKCDGYVPSCPSLIQPTSVTHALRIPAARTAVRISSASANVVDEKYALDPSVRNGARFMPMNTLMRTASSIRPRRGFDASRAVIGSGPRSPRRYAP